MARARRGQAILICLHIVLPEFPFRDIRKAEFPVLFRLVDTRDKTFALLFLREMKEEFDDARAVGMEMFLQIDDGTIPVVPDLFLVAYRIGNELLPVRLTPT